MTRNRLSSFVSLLVSFVRVSVCLGEVSLTGSCGRCEQANRTGRRRCYSSRRTRRACRITLGRTHWSSHRTYVQTRLISCSAYLNFIRLKFLSRLPISQEFLVAGPFNASLTLAAPPPSLTIFAINAYLVQTTKIVSPKPGGRTAEFKCRKQYLVREGERDGYSFEMFASQTRKRGQLVFDGSKIGKPGGLKKGEMWTWSKFGRIVSTVFPVDRDVNCRFSLS